MSWAFNSPNLSCIQIDDATWATANHSVNIDSHTTYSNECLIDCSIGLNKLSANDAMKTLVLVTDLLGRKTEEKPNTVLIYVYSDGTSKKVFRCE